MLSGIAGYAMFYFALIVIGGREDLCGDIVVMTSISWADYGYLPRKDLYC